AGGQADGLVLLVPRSDGKLASVGTVAHVDESVRLPGGRQAALVRGLHRGLIHEAAEERAGTLWINVEAAPDPPLDQLPVEALELAKEYRAIVENLLDLRDASSISQMV